MSSEPLSLERYAEIRAEMEAGVLRDEVLTRAGITVDAWTSVQRAWLEKMGAELERGRFELTNRYTQAFLERQQALKADEHATPTTAKVPTPATEPALIGFPLPPAQPSMPETTPPQGAPAPHAPPFVDLPKIAWLAGLPEDVDLTATLPPMQRDPTSKALPFHKGLTEVGRAKPGETGVRVSETRTNTHPPAPPVRATSALPFRAQSVETSSNESVEDAASRTLPPEAFAAHLALPFYQGQGENEDDEDELAMTMVVRGASSSQGHQPSHPSEDFAGMTLVASALAPRGPALPFQTGKDAGDDDRNAGMQPVRAPSENAAHIADNVEPEDDSDMPTLPPPPQNQALSLADHASLCAKLALSPADTEQIFAQYGLASPETRSAVDEVWKERLRKEPKLYEEWQQLYRMFYAKWQP